MNILVYAAVSSGSGDFAQDPVPDDLWREFRKTARRCELAGRDGGPPDRMYAGSVFFSRREEHIRRNSSKGTGVYRYDLLASDPDWVADLVAAPQLS